MSRARTSAPRLEDYLPAKGTVVTLSLPGGTPLPHLVIEPVAGNRLTGRVDLGGLAGGPVLAGAERGTFVAVSYTLPDGTSRAAVRRVVSVAGDRTGLRLRWPGPGVADLRARPRVPLNAPASIGLHGRGSRVLQGSITDVSVGGCRVRVTDAAIDDIATGRLVTLLADTPLGPLTATAEVRSAAGDSMGVRFLQLDAASARWVRDLDETGAPPPPPTMPEGAALVWIAEGSSPAGRAWAARALPPASDGCPRFELLSDDEDSTRNVAPMQPAVTVAATPNGIDRVRARTTYGTYATEVILERAQHEVLPVHPLPRPEPAELWLAHGASLLPGRVAVTGVGPLAIDVTGIAVPEACLATLILELSPGPAAILVHVPPGRRGEPCRLAVIEATGQLLLSGDDAAPAAWWLPVWLCERLHAAHEARRAGTVRQPQRPART